MKTFRQLFYLDAYQKSFCKIKIYILDLFESFKLNTKYIFSNIILAEINTSNKYFLNNNRIQYTIQYLYISFNFGVLYTCSF